MEAQQLKQLAKVLENAARLPEVQLDSPEQVAILGLISYCRTNILTNQLKEHEARRKN